MLELSSFISYPNRVPNELLQPINHAWKKYLIY